MLGNGPRRANGLGPWIPKQLEKFRCPRDATPLTKPSSCEVCSAFNHVAACTLARSPIRNRYPGASDISSPPCLLRLLPAGANRRVGLAPTGKRRLVTAHVERRPSTRSWRKTDPPASCHSGRGDRWLWPYIEVRHSALTMRARFAGISAWPRECHIGR